MRLPPPLNGLSAEDQAVLSARLTHARFAAGEPIFRAGDPSEGCYIIQAGQVRLEIGGDQHIDAEPVLAYLGADALLGELGVLDGLCRSVTAYAETDVEAGYLSLGAIDDICSRHPAIGTALFRALARDASLKLRRTNARLIDQAAEAASDDGADAEIDRMAAAAAAAQMQIEGWSESRIDELLQAIAVAVAGRAEDLAQATVRETRLGNAPDKTAKNLHASMGICRFLTGKTGRGLLDGDDGRQVKRIAGPVGIVFATIPVTSPVATAVFKTLIAIKARCALIMSFHRACRQVGAAVCDLIERALSETGAPVHLIQCVRSRPSRARTRRFMSHPSVSLILATGGVDMVRAAYSCGKPALGGGPANTPTYVAADADVARAARDVVASKSYDNGLICGAEHNLIVHAAVRETFVAALVRNGAGVLAPPEWPRLDRIIHPERNRLLTSVIGQSAAHLCVVMGIERPYPVRLLVAPVTVQDLRSAGPLVREKLLPLLSLMAVDSDDEGLSVSRQILAIEGAGHTAIIHTRSSALAERYADAMPASRILVNSPGVHGIAGITTDLVPSFTLGCGSLGGNSTTDNISYRHLQNVKRLAYACREYAEEPEGAVAPASR